MLEWVIETVMREIVCCFEKGMFLVEEQEAVDIVVDSGSMFVERRDKHHHLIWEREPFLPSFLPYRIPDPVLDLVLQEIVDTHEQS